MSKWKIMPCRETTNKIKLKKNILVEQDENGNENYNENERCTKEEEKKIKR